MKRFQSPLQVVQLLRQREEQQRLERYAEALNRRHTILQELEDLQTRIADLGEICLEAFRDQTTAGQHQRLQDCLDSMRRQRERVEAKLEEAERQVTARLHQMLVARRRREGLDRLIELRRSSHRREEEKQAQQALDEL